MKKIALSDIQTKAVFDLIFGSTASLGLNINDQDKKQASMLLDELIQRSCQMSVIQGIFEIEYSFNINISSVARSVISSYYSNCNRGAKDATYYETVRRTIARNWHSPFELRKQEGVW